MNSPTSKQEQERLVEFLREAYMEIFPSAGIEEQLERLEHNAYVAVTCSPTKGIDDTLALTETLIGQGLRVAPHIAAKNVRSVTHLKEILARLADLGVESIFVPGGDRPEPIGDFNTAVELVRALHELDHSITEIGIAAHPEGISGVDDEVLLRALQDKQPFVQYAVTQMCFDAELMGNWLVDIRSRGIEIPVWIGLPGAIERGRLLRTSMRIGVGDSLRFLKRKSDVAAKLMKSSIYKPDELLADLARYLVMPEANVAGFHLFCFNQVASTEDWRIEAIGNLS